jgi:PhnB protein
MPAYSGRAKVSSQAPRGPGSSSRAGKPKILDGPFTESKELIAGFSLIEVGSKDEALEWVKRWPTVDGNGEVEIEIRQVYELSDLGSAAAMEPHAKLRERLSRK